MKPIRTFLQQNAIRFWLNVEKPFHSISKGKLAKNMFIKAVEHPYVGSKVRIIKETDNATYIAKFKDDGSFDDGDFKIMTGTDMHLYDVPEDVNKTLEMFAKQVRDEKPDLIIFTGDVLLTKFQHLDTIQFAQFMEDLGVYWAYAFGNHEAREEKEYFKYFIFKGFCDYPHCLCKFGDPELFGFGNYIINIMNSETELRQSLVLFDSGRDICEPHITNDKLPEDIAKSACYDYIKPSQIIWFENEMKALKKEYGKVEPMLYMHIPIPEYQEVYNHIGDNTYAPSGKAEILYGYQFESVGCSKYNSGLFDAMKRVGAKAIFSGHDHVNDWAAKYDGILLVYNQCGGYGCYNMYNYDNFRYKWEEKDWMQGYTITTVRKDGSFELRQSFNAKYLNS
ncbi:MAG: metallophosphoesterase [Clostridia bacterium]|nr:metallophosphoesterase [Clostridia bacterium]